MTTQIKTSITGSRTGVTVPLRVAENETVDIGDVTLTPSTGITIISPTKYMNAQTVTLNRLGYPAGTCVIFAFSATQTGTIDIAYTGSLGTVQTLQLDVIDNDDPPDVGVLGEAIANPVGSLLTSLETLLAAFGTGVPVSLTSDPGALVPGTYIVDTSGGAFAVALQASQKGTWTFIDPDGCTASAALTIGTSGETYNGVAGGVTFDSGIGRVIVTNHAGSTAYVLEVY